MSIEATPHRVTREEALRDAAKVYADAKIRIETEKAIRRAQEAAREHLAAAA